MADNRENDLVRNLNFNALLMLSFYEKAAEMSDEDKAQYKAMMTFEDASAASVFLLSVMMTTYASETGRTKEELATFMRAVLLDMSNLEN
jgi:hypothetical protein